MSKKTKRRTKRKTKRETKKGKSKNKNKDEAIHIRLALYVFNSRKKTKKNKKRNRLSKSIRRINGYNILVDINDPLLDGYIEDKKLSTKDNGVYVNQKDKHVVFSVRGTDVFESLKDLYYDLKIVLGSEIKTKYYKRSYNLFKKVIQKYKGYKITLTGYSLGGRIVINLLDSDLGENIDKVYAFNPATFINQIRKSKLCSEGKSIQCGNRDKLNIYLVNGDIISSFAKDELAGKHKVFKKHKKSLFKHDAYTFYLKL